MLVMYQIIGGSTMKKENRKDRGLTLVYTGDGKGKTTAALGLVLRAVGRGWCVKMYQCINSLKRSYGERNALKKLGVEMVQIAISFTWTKTAEKHRQALKKAWPIARDAVMSGEYDVVILDELNNALSIDRFPIDDVLPREEVFDMIKNKPKH